MSREKLRAISRNNIRETFRGPAGRSDPFELLVLKPPVLRNGLRIIAETTHRRSSRPSSPTEKDSRTVIPLGHLNAKTHSV